MSENCKDFKVKRFRNAKFELATHKRERDSAGSTTTIMSCNMSDKAYRTSYVSWNDETSNEERTYRFHSENSQAASSYNSEAEGYPKVCQGELQHSAEKKAESLKQKSRAGIFNRLRKRLNSRFEQLPGKWTTSSVRATNICSDAEVAEEGLRMVPKKRAPCYRCVPNPPGCIPTEVMMSVEDVFYSPPLNRPGQGERSADIEGTNHEEEVNPDDDRKRSENGQEIVAFSPNAEMCKVNRPTKMLINNWIDPEQGC